MNKYNRINDENKVPLGISWAEMSKILKKTEWLWPLWLPKGYLVLVTGESGVGKSYFLIYLVGVITQGFKFPDGFVYTGNCKRVVWIEAEAAQAMNNERAEKMGIDLENINSFTEDPFKDFKITCPSDQKRLLELASRDDIEVIMIDSLSGINTSDENSSDMSKHLKKLAEIARDTHTTIILTHHLRKKSIIREANDKLERVRGSSGIVQNARVVINIDQPNRNISTKRISVVKSNLGKLPAPIGFEILENGTIKFTDPPEEQIPNSQLETAKAFLLDLLHDGAQKAKDVYEAAQENNISKKTLQLAKKQLSVKSSKTEENGKSFWNWSLPTGKNPLKN
jgi:archaellum biogenesis ATPase FlaH